MRRIVALIALLAVIAPVFAASFDEIPYSRKVAQQPVKEAVTAVRAAAILTDAYVAGTAIDMANYNYAVIFVDFTIGSLTNASIKLEFSMDNVNWYQESSVSVAAGVATTSAKSYLFAATGKYCLEGFVMGRYMRISAISTGTATSSSMAIFVAKSNN